MQKLIELNIDPSILISSNLKELNKPDSIFIPVFKEVELLVQNNAPVNIGTPIYQINNEVILSPISGVINGVKKIMTLKGECAGLEIANDFQEKTLKEPNKRNLKNIPLADIEEIINKFSIDLKNKQNLILNAIDDEPYTITENFYLFLHYDGFLEILDFIGKIYKLKNIIICVKSQNSANINKLMDTLGMYPNITLRIVPNLYLIGKKEFLLPYLNVNNSESCLITTSKFYAVYNLIKRNRFISDKLLTITGNALKSSFVLQVKIGTSLEFILNNLNLPIKNVQFICNGLMSGSIIDIKNFIITEDISSIFIMNQNTEKKSSTCLKCGACINICPVNINPTLLNNPEYYEKIKDKCLKCGLCSYICPSYINFNKITKGEEPNA